MSESAEERFAHLCVSVGAAIPTDYLELALMHRSYAYENGGLPTNERLEFLGDSVLSLHVTEALYRNFPDLPEGRLAKLRASVVNMRALASVARTLGPNGLGEYIRLGRGETVTGGADKDSILADALEAILGAVHMGNGPEAAKTVVRKLFDPLIEAAASSGAGLDWKTHLQELTATRGLGVPAYRLHHTGPDHARVFSATVVLGENAYGSGSGRTKKEAEQIAARLTVETIDSGAASDD